MFKNVIVGVEGRQGGRDAMALAARMTGSDGTQTLVHVRDGASLPSHTISAGLPRQERESSEKLLDSERAGSGADAELLSILSSSPGRGLHEQAEELMADLLVVGSCSRSAIGRVRLGDDTREALNGAPCAVAVAPRGYAEGSAPLLRVGVAYNGSPESVSALATARELAAARGGTVHALEVISIPSYAYTGLVAPPVGNAIEVMLAEGSTRMEELAAGTRAAGLPDVMGEAVYGVPGEELAVFGDQVDILIVGSRGYGAWRRLVLGSTSDYLERHARCPLLVLPRAAADAQDQEDQELQTPLELLQG